MKKMNYSDINVIACLFAGKNPVITIIDPIGILVYDEQPATESKGKNVLVNFSRKEIKNLNNFDLIIDFSKRLILKSYKQQSFKTVIAPNGILRYLVTNNRTNFLDFYHNTTFKSTCIKLGLGLLFNLRISHFIFPSFNVLTKNSFSFLEEVASNSYNHYAIFTGTPGFWRKPVVQFSHNKRVVSYAKIPINKQTELVISNEKKHLLDIQKLRLKNIVHPTTIHNSKLLLLTNISSKKQINTSLFSMCHFNAIQELKEKSIQKEILEDSVFFKNLNQQIKKCNSNVHFPKINKVITYIFNSINKNEFVELHIAHGDFTNWNTTLLNNQLYCYDWEMKIDKAPLYYDVFHFLHQTATFIKHKKENIYKKTISFLDKNGIQFSSEKLKIAYILYLLDVISKNIVLTSKQKSVSKDQKSMITNWYASLIETTTLKN